MGLMGPVGGGVNRGPQGYGQPGLDGNDGQDGYPIPGPAGPAGSSASSALVLLEQHTACQSRLARLHDGDHEHV